MTNVQMRRSFAIELINAQLGEYLYDQEDYLADLEEEPEDRIYDSNPKHSELTNDELVEVFCTSGVFNHVFDGSPIGEKDFGIID